MVAILVGWSPPASRAQIQSGLIGYWKLDGNYTDLSPGHRHLTAAGGIGFDAGIKGQAAVFPGNSGQWLQRPSDDEVYDFGSGDFTIVLWVRFDGTADNQIFVEKWVGPSGPGWTFAKHPDNSILFNASGPGALVSPVITLTPGLWYQFAVVRTGSSIEMYRDNQLIAAEYGTYAGPIDNVSKPLLLGLRDGPAFPLDGRLDEVAIWSRALTSAELTDLYSAHQMICNCATQPSGFAGGDGTPENPYQVCSPLHLDNVRNNLDASYVQTADIDMSGRIFEPIATNTNKLTGFYNGRSFTISNLSISKSNNYVGLFASTSGTGQVTFTNLQNLAINGVAYVGGMVGHNEGLIEDCAIDGTIIGEDTVGGFVGLNEGTVRRSSALGTVQGVGRLGGFVGQDLQDRLIEDCYSHSSVSASSSIAGGFVGLSTAGAFTNCYSIGPVASPMHRGGFAGAQLGGASTVVASFWDTQTSSVPTSVLGVGKTTEEMQQLSTFTPPWDFENVWMIDEGNDYPRLRSHTIVPPGPSETSCTNALDDDCDSFVDCDDMDCTGDDVCLIPALITPESPAIGKVRFISFVVPATSAGTDTALRVELTSLHHPSSPPPGTPDFTALEGQFRYVNSFGGSTLCVDSATFGTNYRCGTLGCQPEYRDWATQLSAATNPASPDGLIHVSGDSVVPSSTLTVSHIAASCGAAPAADTCIAASAGLAISTVRWGDAGSGGGGGPDGNTNVIDIGLVVDNVKGLATAIPERRAWMKNPANPFVNPVNVIDIGLTVDAVKGLPYPYSIAVCP